MRTESLDFDLPADLLAARPIEHRGLDRHDAQMVVFHRGSGRIEFRQFRNLPEYLSAGDVVVLNDSRTLNASVFAEVDGCGRVELLLRYNPKGNVWGVQCHPYKEPPIGAAVRFGESPMTATVLGRDKALPLWLVEFSGTPAELVEFLDGHGRPIPSPYVAESFSNAEYNTLYAERPGSAEMPAAGRHFTDDVLERLRGRGVEIVKITLHTGLSSVEIHEAELADHEMYPEWYQLPAATAEAVNGARDHGRTVLIVGTTVMRTVETVARERMPLVESTGWTKLYIHPGFEFKLADALITNFHGPRSSRIALAAAFTGRELLLRGYREAIERRLQFYEFGDTTLTLPD